MLYELEPQMRDVYVEGHFDVRVLNWVFKDTRLPKTVVYEIDSIDIPARIVLDLGLEDNRRSRLIAFAQLADKWNITSNAITCVADSDFNCFQGVKYQHRCLLYTDYASMDGYLFDPRTLEKVVFSCGCDTFDLGTLWASMVEVLRTLFRVRFANSALGTGFAWMKCDRCLSLDGSRIILDVNEFLRRYLSKNSGLAKRAAFLERISGAPVPGLDDRRMIHKEDFVDLVSWYIAKACSLQKHGLHNVVRVGLLSALSRDDVKECELFKRLLERIGRN